MKKTDKLIMQIQWWNDYSEYVYTKSYIVDLQAKGYADKKEKERLA
tara:strand:- start:3235 stop:3372 length:138 start_codon:yes stop_codon:yes gene_type:complete